MIKYAKWSRARLDLAGFIQHRVGGFCSSLGGTLHLAALITEEGEEGIFPNRLAVVVTLGDIALTFLQVFDLVKGLGAFCNNGQTQAVSQLDDRINYGAVIRVFQHILHKGAVNFDLIHGHFFQIAQRGVAGAKIVDSQLHTDVFHLFQKSNRQIHIFHNRRFGDFQHQVLGGNAGFAHQAFNCAHQIRLMQLDSADIHRNREVVKTGF